MTSPCTHSIVVYSLHLARKHAPIFVLGHNMFLEVHSFLRTSTTLSENCSILGKDNVRGYISEHIFAPNVGYCLFLPRTLLYIEVRSIEVSLYYALT